MPTMGSCIMSALPNFTTADAARDHEGELSEDATRGQDEAHHRDGHMDSGLS